MGSWPLRCSVSTGLEANKDGAVVQFPSGIKTVASCLVFSIKIAHLQGLLEGNLDLETLKAALIRASKHDNEGLLGTDTRRPIIMKKRSHPGQSLGRSRGSVSKGKAYAISIPHLTVGINLEENSRRLKSYSTQAPLQLPEGGEHGGTNPIPLSKFMPHQTEI